jgi:outer membrane protein assembly factor BamB
MQSEAMRSLVESPAGKGPEGPMKPARLWPGVAIVGLYWILFIIVGRVDKQYFVGFLYGMGSAAVLVLAYFGWWWASRRIRLADRLFGFLLILGGGIAALPLCHPSVGWIGLLMTGLPVVLTVWTLWMFVVRKTGPSRHWLGSVVVVALTWGFFTLIRIEGLNSDLQADTRWRWASSAEDQFLASRASAAQKGEESGQSALGSWAPSLTPNDWTGFRGPDREGVLHGVTIATDWNARPPRLLWRQRVGPAWSSVTIIGDRLFTQEQRGSQETVVCYEASSGKEIWVHEDKARFWETVSGAGPRATPTFADGRIYTLGGTGLLNSLDAGSGLAQWSRDTAAEAGAKVPMWGFSGSPLVIDGKVVVFTGGEASLRAYGADSGEQVWSAEAGPGSYSSPQLATIAGQPQILILSESGLSSFDPANGAKLWEHGLAMPGAPRTLQPHRVGESLLAGGTVEGNGVALIDVSRAGGTWQVVERWQSTQLKPEFPDFVVHEGYAYGFDVNIFACIDLATGKRCWKAGRYGRGQVILLADQGVLLVISETGEAVLLAANPKEQQELGRFQAVNGKTWNHPVIAHGRLYVRNAEEIACYELPTKE